MLVVAYQGRAIKNYSELFEAYIEKQLNNPDLQGTYSPRKSPSKKRALHYLIWLARKLEAEREPEFLIEGMQPTWLESTKQKFVYRVFVGLIGGLIAMLIGGPIVGLIVGLIGGRGNIIPVEKWNFSSQKAMNNLIVGLIGGLVFGLIGGLRGGLLAVIQHFTLRLIIYRNGDIPWNYAKFLEHAVKHRFIQRLGGRYRFMHDLLRKHFAKLAPD